MDPKVSSKLLTHHRRGYGVDVEALRDRFPLRQSADEGSRWNLADTKGYGGGNCVLDVNGLYFTLLYYFGD